MKENEKFLEQKNDNRETKVCFICGERHPFEANKITEAYFLVMVCPKENVKLGGRTVDIEKFVFLRKHILS